MNHTEARGLNPVLSWRQTRRQVAHTPQAKKDTREEGEEGAIKQRRVRCSKRTLKYSSSLVKILERRFERCT